MLQICFKDKFNNHHTSRARGVSVLPSPVSLSSPAALLLKLPSPPLQPVGNRGYSIKPLLSQLSSGEGSVRWRTLLLLVPLSADNSAAPSKELFDNRLSLSRRTALCAPKGSPPPLLRRILLGSSATVRKPPPLPPLLLPRAAEPAPSKR